LAGERPLGLE
jgi:hypothetical protein